MTTMQHGRSWAELVAKGGTKILFHHPCGHTSTKDYAKGPRVKRLGPEACAMFARWWGKAKGGVTAPCPKGCVPTNEQREAMNAEMGRAADAHSRGERP